MRCQVSGLMHGDTFTWQYDLQDLTTRGRIAVTQELLTSTSDSSWDGALVLTVSNVRDGDSGTYVCSVQRPGVETPEITAKQAFLTVYFFPGDGNPTCEPGGPVTIYFGEGTTLACWTDEGNPTVDLVISSSDLDPTMIWSKTDTGNNITKRAYWTADAFRGEFAFSCEIASSRYPGERRNCTIGPIRVEERPLPTTPQPYFSQSVSESATPALESSTTFPSLTHTNDSVANSSEVSLTIGSASADNSVTFTRSNSPAVIVSRPSVKDMFTFGGTQSVDTSNEQNLPQTTSRSDTIIGVSDRDPFTTSASGGYSKTVSPVFMFNLTTLMSNLKSTSVLNTPITPPSNTETIPAETFLTARQTVHTTTTMLSIKSSPIQTHRASSSPTEKVPNEQRTAETSQIVLQSATGAIWTEEGAEQVTATLSPSTSEVVPTEARIVKTTMRVPPSTTEFVPSEQGTVGTSPGVTQFKTESTPTGERTEQITATLLSPESESVPIDALNVTTISGSTLSSTEIVLTEQSTVKTTQIELPLVTETIPIEPRTEQITTTPLSSTTGPTQTETHIVKTTLRASPSTITSTVLPSGTDALLIEERNEHITATLPSSVSEYLRDEAVTVKKTPESLLSTTESVPTELRTVRIWPVVPPSETETIRIEPRTEQITATLSSSTYEPPQTETMTTLRPPSTTEMILTQQRTVKSTQILLPLVTDALSTEDRTEQMTGTLLSSTSELIPTERTIVETPSGERPSTNLNQIVPNEQRITETTAIVLHSETEGISTGLSTGKSTLPVLPTTAGITSTEAITVKTTQITVPSTGQTSTEHGVSTLGNMPTVHLHTTETMIPTESKTPVTAPSTPASSTSQSVPTESWNVKSSEKAILTTVPTERRTELTTSSPLPGVSTSDTYEPTELTPTKPSEESKQPSPNWAIAFAVTAPPSILCLVIVVKLFFKIRHMKRFEWTAVTDALMSRDQQETQSEMMSGTVNCASNEFIQLDKV